MSISRWGLSVVAALLFAGSAAMADDAASLKAELADLKAKVSSMESAQASCGTEACGVKGDCESLTSMKKKGVISIGGGVAIDVIVNNRDDGVGEDDEIDSTSFTTDDAYLTFEVKASADVALNIKLDLDDAWNGANQDDLLEECYFVWKNVRCSNWSLAFGKKSIDYGMGKTIGITDSLMADKVESIYWLGANEEYEDAANAHAAVGSLGALPGSQPTNLFAIEAEYKWCDIARFYAAVFQNARGMNEDRSDDHLGLQSFALKAEVTPLENLMVQVSFMNRHFDSMGNEDVFGTDAEADTYALSVGLTYDFACLPLSVWAEYQHGWDLGYDEDADSDVFGVGLIWGVTECIDLGLMAEYASIEDVAGFDDEDYLQVAVNATYNFDNGIYMTLEYAHVWYDGEVAGGNDVDADADMIGFRTGWEF